MTAPTREQVVQWAEMSQHRYSEWNIDIEYFATLARADLEATIAEQAKEIADQHWRLNKNGRCGRSR